MENNPTLKISANQIFLPLVVSFIENCSAGYSFSAEETTPLTLASEEIFSYLCMINEHSPITIECKSKKYLIEVTWIFSGSHFNPRAFNITTKTNPDDESSLEEMGLLIANRVTDNFNMYEEGNNIIISFSKFRSYPGNEQDEYNPNKLTELKIAVPEKQQIILLSSIIRQESNAEIFPSFLKSPFLLADMYEQKDVEARIISDNNGMVAGGVLWRKAGNESCEMFGPFIHKNFEAEKYYDKLVDSCLESIGKENYKGLICLTPGNNFPSHYFEVIGSYSGRNIYFRELQEDTGVVSWINEKIKDYIKEQYEKLYLPRQIVIVPQYDSSKNKYSVISTEINRMGKSVKMIPRFFGTDLNKNIEEHIKLFIEERFSDIFFEVDLGVNSHSLFIPALLENGFAPSFVIPLGGRGDLLMMKYSSQNEGQK